MTHAFARLEATQAAADATGAVRMELGGDLPSEAVPEEPGGQEIIGILVAVVVLLVAFGSVIAMGLPIGTALVGLATSIGLITLVASFVDVNSVVPDPRRHDRPRASASTTPCSSSPATARTCGRA